MPFLCPASASVYPLTTVITINRKEAKALWLYVLGTQQFLDPTSKQNL